MIVSEQRYLRRLGVALSIVTIVAATFAVARPSFAAAQPAADAVQASAREAVGGEANLVLPDLSTVNFRGVNGRTLLMRKAGGASSGGND